MTKDERSTSTGTSLQRRIVFLLLGLPTLVITVNSFDSGIAKTPLLVLLASLLVMVYAVQVIRTGELRFRSSPADTPVLMLLTLMIISTLYSESRAGSLRALELWIPFILCFFAGTQLFPNGDADRKLTRVLAIISSVVVLVGLIQFLFPAQLFLDFFIGTDRRVTSTLTNSTYLSGYVVLVFPLMLTAAVSEPRGTGIRWALLALLFGLACVLFVTSTRSSIAAFLVSLLGLIVLSKRASGRAIAWGVSAILLIVVAVYLTPHLASRIESSFRNDPASTLARRMYFWEAGFRAWKAAPFFGHGIGSYEKIMPHYRSPDYWVVKSEDVVPHAHNEIIETAVDLGGIGVAVEVLILGTVIVPGLRQRENEKRRDRLMRIGLCCSVLAILVDNLANVSLRVAPVGATAWLLFGVLASHVSRTNAPKVIELRAPRWLVLLPVCGWLAFVILYGIQLWPRYLADGHLIKGSLATAARRISEATNEYRVAVSLDPDNPLARSNLALLLLQGDHYQEALEAARQLQQFAPDYPKSYLFQASALVALKRYPEALDQVENELRLRDHPEAYYYQAMAHMGMGDTAGEIQSLERLLQSDMKGRLNFQLAPVSRRLMVLAREEDLNGLVEIYGQLSKTFPSEANVTSTLSALEARRNDAQARGKSAGRQELTSHPGDPP